MLFKNPWVSSFPRVQTKWSNFHPLWPRNVHRNSGFLRFSSYSLTFATKTLMGILSSIIFYKPYVLNIASHAETTSVRKAGWCCFHFKSCTITISSIKMFPQSKLLKEACFWGVVSGCVTSSDSTPAGLVKLTVVTKTLHQVFILSEQFETWRLGFLYIFGGKT